MPASRFSIAIDLQVLSTLRCISRVHAAAASDRSPISSLRSPYAVDATAQTTAKMAVATTMISYGGFLGACGWYGAHTSGAMHSLYAGVGSGAVMIMCGANSFGEPKKGDKAVTQSRK